MDWIFISKVVFLLIFTLIIDTIYRSKWLYIPQNKFIFEEIEIPNFLIPLAKNFFKNGISFFAFTMFFGIIFLFGLFAIFTLIFDGVKSFQKSISEYSWRVKMGMYMGLIEIFYLIRIQWNKYKKNSNN